MKTNKIETSAIIKFVFGMLFGTLVLSFGLIYAIQVDYSAEVIGSVTIMAVGAITYATLSLVRGMQEEAE